MPYYEHSGLVLAHSPRRDAASEQELARYARSMAPSIGEDGKRKILAGQTTVEEVMRVSLDD